MTVTYYLKNCFWGLFGPGFLAYNILNDLQDGLIFPAYIPYMPYVAIYLAIGAVIYPFSFFVLEQLAMKIMKKETWRYYFTFDGRSRGLFIFSYMLCALLSIPLFMLYPIINKKR